MSADFVVTINGPRGEEWERIAGTRRFPVQSPLPILANMPGHQKAEAFLVDLEELAPEVLAKIVAHLRRKFHLTESEAAEEVQKAGLPILNEDCMVTILNPMKWLGDLPDLDLADDDDDPWEDDDDEDEGGLPVFDDIRDAP